MRKDLRIIRAAFFEIWAATHFRMLDLVVSVDGAKDIGRKLASLAPEEK